MDYLDFITATLDLFTTYLYVIASMWMWPLTIFTSLLNIYLFYHVGIYGDAGKALFYVVSAIYGWYYWQKGKRSSGHLEIGTLSWYSSGILIGVAITSITTLGYILKSTMHSTVAYWDATTTTLSIISQCLFCVKKIETWFLWFVVDSIYLVLYFYKGIPFNASITMVYLCMAVMGYFRWKRLRRDMAEPQLNLAYR